MAWVQEVGRSHGYVIITRRSKTKNGYLAKLILMCDRGGLPNNKDSTTTFLRKHPSKKVDCKFELVAKFSKKKGVWSLTVKNPTHNHEPAMFMEGHAYAMRLNDDEISLVADLSSYDVKARDILSKIKEKNEDNVSSSRTIYNTQQKLRATCQAHLTPMQIVMSFLQVKGYDFQHRINDSTNELEELFWIHPLSYKILHAFPHVLLMDATYKTNLYRLPFLQIVGVTSTNKTFSVAFVLLDREKRSNFIWALNCLKLTIGESYEPRVIVTDRDLALMNACQTVFPGANKLLCRWHIWQNIFRQCKKYFKSQKEWDSFYHTWDSLVKTPTMESYMEIYTKLQAKLIHYPDVLSYINGVWLDKYAHMFVSVLTDKYLNFGNSTTNRVESQHAKVKLSLASTQSKVDRFVPIIDKIVLSQETIIKESFERSRIFRWPEFNLPYFQLLWGFVSYEALEKIYNELNRSNGLELTNENCGCQLRSCFGLPCAHELAMYINAGYPIPLESIDVFWKKLDFSSCISPRDEDIPCDAELEKLKKKLR